MSAMRDRFRTRTRHRRSIRSGARSRPEQPYRKRLQMEAAYRQEAEIHSPPPIFSRNKIRAKRSLRREGLRKSGIETSLVKIAPRVESMFAQGMRLKPLSKQSSRALNSPVRLCCFHQRSGTVQRALALPGPGPHDVRSLFPRSIA